MPKYLGCTDYDITSRSYARWRGIIYRGYSEEFHEKHPEYIGCTVDKEWWSYSNFRKWYDENYKQVPGETVDIDKDILLPGNMEYGPASARFVPHCINTLILGADRSGKLPTGVDLHNNRYRARVTHGGRKIECGTYKTA